MEGRKSRSKGKECDGDHGVGVGEELVIIREFSEKRGDREVVGKLEEKCGIVNTNNGSVVVSKGASICTNTVSGDPLCRIRFYPLHVMLVAEIQESREVVGVVRGCIKSVGTCFGESCVKFGCMLGLRVSPTHRRMGIGLKLVKSLEDWMTINGAEYILLATEKTNIVAMNLFTLRCNYKVFSSLVIYIHPVTFPMKEKLQDIIKVEKLHVDQAVSFYEKRLKGKDIYPTDISTILKEKLSLGTWVLFIKDEERIETKNEGRTNVDFVDDQTVSSWVIFSVWNTSDAYKLVIRKSNHIKLFTKIFSCLRGPAGEDSSQEPFGFLFLYGLYGEGDRVGELIKCMWKFAASLAQDLKECQLVMTELGHRDPLGKHITLETCMTCIDDLWCLKRLVGTPDGGEDDDLTVKGPVGDVFVDPRDF